MLTTQNKIYSVFIDTTPNADSPCFIPLAEGFYKIKREFNEVALSQPFIGEGGFASTVVTGAQVVIKMFGKRIFGNLAQDFLFSGKVWCDLYAARLSRVKLVLPDGSAICGNATFAHLSDEGGSADELDEIYVEIHFNGLPDFIGF